MSGGRLADTAKWNLPGSQEIAQTAETLSALNWQSFAPLAQPALAESARVVRPHQGAGA